MKKKNNKQKLTGTYRTNPLIQPDKKQKQTNVPLPDEENVEAGREWSEVNEQ